MASSSLSSLLFLFLALVPSFALDSVPPKNTFEMVNNGPYGIYNQEYYPDYRSVSHGNAPFYFNFYNTTPGKYSLGLKLGTKRSESRPRWVWEANRGDLVGENAVFALRFDGNMLLAEADGRIVWQTNTANKGVVGMKVLPTGNIVLYDAKNNFVWQSFDHPTDTLLVGQYLKLGGPTKLVSRKSFTETANGAYSLELEPTRLALYYTSPLDSQRYLYFSSVNWFKVLDPPLKQVTLSTIPKRANAFSYDATLNYQGSNSSRIRKFLLSSPKHNPILSFIRLLTDGDLVYQIYNDDVSNSAWDFVFILFSSPWESECQLPTRCGEFGLCLDNQCVACPAGNFEPPYAPWDESCSQPTLKSCVPGDYVYKKLVGVDHFLCKYTNGDGPMSQEACAAKCTGNCKCKGFFYHEKTSRCWTVGDLKTLISVDDTSHLAFLKAPK